MDEIADRWDDTDPNDVMCYTDTDLTFSRNWSTRLYDPTGEYRNKALAIQNKWDLEDLSATLDFATRIALAKMIDDNEIPINRDQFNIRYTIPPRGWIRHEIGCSLSVSKEEHDDEYIQISMPPVCKEMVEATIDDGLFENKKEVMQYGVDLLTTNMSNIGSEINKIQSNDGETKLIHLFELFRKDSSNKLISYFINNMIDKYRYKIDIEEGSGVNHESVRQNLGSGDNLGILEKYGIVERSDWEANSPRYRLADSDVVEFIQQYDGYTFSLFFQNETRRDVFLLFVQQAESGETYTRTQLANKLGISFDPIDKTLEQMREAGMVKANNNGRSIDYSYVPDAEVERSANQFNSLLHQEYENNINGKELGVFGEL